MYPVPSLSQRNTCRRILSLERTPLSLVYHFHAVTLLVSPQGSVVLRVCCGLLAANRTAPCTVMCIVTGVPMKIQVIWLSSFLADLSISRICWIWGMRPPFILSLALPEQYVKKMASIITRLLSTTLQEEIDLWRLYHMVHYFELCEGKNVKVPKPPKSSLRQQRKRVEACITTQVAVRHCRHLACVLG